MKHITLLALVLVLPACAIYEKPRANNAPEKVFVCHKGKQTLDISEAALSAHLKHGDRRGPC